MSKQQRLGDLPDGSMVRLWGCVNREEIHSPGRTYVENWAACPFGCDEFVPIGGWVDDDVIVDIG